MAINYAPILDGSLSGFYGTELTLPFTMNQAVGEGDVGGFAIRIKTIANNVLKIDKQYIFNSSYKKSDNWDQKNSTITFNFTSDEVGVLSKGFYKVQIAYIDNNKDVSPYSTVGIIKYTKEPSLSITIKNQNPLSLTGNYTPADKSEKLYSSYFVIKRDSDKEEMLRTEKKIHNTDKDTTTVQHEDLNSNINFSAGVNYTIYFCTTSINGVYKKTSISFKPSSLSTDTSLSNLSATLEKDEGRIVIEAQTAKAGKFLIARASNKDNFSSWDILCKKKEIADTEEIFTMYTDYAIEHGIKYKYCIYTLDSNGDYEYQTIIKKEDDKGNKIDLIVTAEFEDLFLSDKDRCLKIRFNPKVSSIKTVLQEAKLETIGSKYPFFFRNGYISYKELPISGLITYFMDDKNTFSDNSKIIKTTQLTDNNIYNERTFKLEVFDWLNNGQPKLFKSPAEGTYLVRLMNVSLSPLSDGLSRMLHTFSATAYEIDELNLDNLVKYDLIKEA